MRHANINADDPKAVVAWFESLQEKPNAACTERELIGLMNRCSDPQALLEFVAHKEYLVLLRSGKGCSGEALIEAILEKVPEPPPSITDAMTGRAAPEPVNVEGPEDGQPAGDLMPDAAGTPDPSASNGEGAAPPSSDR